MMTGSMTADEAFSAMSEPFKLGEVEQAVASPYADVRTATAVIHDFPFLIEQAVSSGLMGRCFSPDELRTFADEGRLSLDESLLLLREAVGDDDCFLAALMSPSVKLSEEFTRSSYFYRVPDKQLIKYVIAVLESGAVTSEKQFDPYEYRSFVLTPHETVHIPVFVEVLNLLSLANEIEWEDKQLMLGLADSDFLDGLFKLNSADRERISAKVASILSGTEQSEEIISYWAGRERQGSFTDSMFFLSLLSSSNPESLHKAVGELCGTEPEDGFRRESFSQGFPELLASLKKNNTSPHTKQTALLLLPAVSSAEGWANRMEHIASLLGVGGFNYATDADILTDAITFTDEQDYETFWGNVLPGIISKQGRMSSQGLELADILCQRILDTNYSVTALEKLIASNVFPSEALLRKHQEVIVGSLRSDTAKSAGSIIVTVASAGSDRFSQTLIDGLIVELLAAPPPIVSISKRLTSQESWGVCVRNAGRSVGVGESLPLSYVEKLLSLGEASFKEEAEK